MHCGSVAIYKSGSQDQYGWFCFTSPVIEILRQSGKCTSLWQLRCRCQPLPLSGLKTVLVLREVDTLSLSQTLWLNTTTILTRMWWLDCPMVLPSPGVVPVSSIPTPPKLFMDSMLPVTWRRNWTTSLFDLFDCGGTQGKTRFLSGASSFSSYILQYCTTVYTIVDSEINLRCATFYMHRSRWALLVPSSYLLVARLGDISGLNQS